MTDTTELDIPGGYRESVCSQTPGSSSFLPSSFFLPSASRPAPSFRFFSLPPSLLPFFPYLGERVWDPGAAGT